MTKKMDKKLFGAFFFGLLAILLVGFVNAATIFSDSFTDTNLTGWTVTPVNSWTHNTGNYTESNNATNAILRRTISTSGFETITVKYDRQVTGGFEADNNFTASWSADGTTFTNLETASTPGNDTSFVSKTFNLPSTTNNNSNFILKFECNTDAGSEFCRLDNVIIEGTPISTPTQIPPEIQSCSSTGNPGDLRIKGIDFTNDGLQYANFGKDDEWFPFENIEAEIEIENNGNEDARDIEVEWGIWDSRAEQWVIELDKEDEINIDQDEQEILKVSFTIDDDMDVDLSDLNDGDHYRFYVKAQGEVDNSTSPTTCVSDFEQASIIIERDFVVLDNFQIPETVQCGETVEVAADVWNIGDRDQDAVSVRVFEKSNTLKIDQDIDIGDIDAFDKQQLSLSFSVPKGIVEKYYTLTFEVEDEDGDVYQNDFDDDYSQFAVPLKVNGSCAATTVPELTISANLESEAVAGGDIIVKLTFVNTGKNLEIFNLSVTEFENFASSASLDQNSLTLGSGQSDDVLLTLNTNKEASGNYLFYVEAKNSDGKVIRQPVSVTIEQRGGIAGITGAAIFGENWLTWTVGILNIILVIIIIIVAVRLGKK